jgi:hypothetical protein
MDQQDLPRHAITSVAWTQWAYWCSLVMAAMAVKYIPAGSVQVGVMLVPALTAALCVVMAYWLYEECDEYLRSAILRCVVRTAIVVAAFTLGAFVFELLGYPRLGMVWVNLIGWSVFNVQMLVVILRSR